MSDVIYIRTSDDGQLKTTLKVQAALYGVPLNEYCLWVLEEATMPHDELVLALQARSEEVESRKRYTQQVVIEDRSRIPQPRAVTQPMKAREKEWML